MIRSLIIGICIKGNYGRVIIPNTETPKNCPDNISRQSSRQYSASLPHK